MDTLATKTYQHIKLDCIFDTFYDHGNVLRTKIAHADLKNDLSCVKLEESKQIRRLRIKTWRKTYVLLVPEPQ